MVSEKWVKGSEKSERMCVFVCLKKSDGITVPFPSYFLSLSLSLLPFLTERSIEVQRDSEEGVQNRMIVSRVGGECGTAFA